MRWSLPGINSADFLELVDDGEGEEAGDRHGSEGIVAEGLSSTPLRMCRYAGADGVAFGEKTALYEVFLCLNSRRGRAKIIFDLVQHVGKE